MPHWQSLFSTLRDHDIHVSVHDMPRPVGGGDISSAWKISTDERPVFLKTGPADACEMFHAEADGLRELAKVGAVRVPGVLGCICSQNESMLALEWLDFELTTESSDRMLGQQLAQQHRSCAEQFGWHRDNTVGSTPQHNSWSDDWVQFFAEQRLGFQLELAASNGFTGELQTLGRRLKDNTGLFFSDYWPEASLLHGDLWSGNRAVAGGTPVVFDPAVYYGDRESDIAMTKLFGGFADSFYDAYEEAWPLSAGHQQRMLLYQLYHLLNHLNLFGSSYLHRAEGMLRELV
jgi:protein-ribulosamine 3-kinase